MFNLFAHSEVNLGRAGWCLLLEVFGIAALTIVSQELGLAGEAAFIGLWMFNLVVAWFLARAAQAAGRNPWLFGLLSVLGPPVAILLFLSFDDRGAPAAAPAPGGGSEADRREADPLEGGGRELDRFTSLMREHGVGESVSGIEAWTAFKAYGEEVIGQPGVALLFQAGTHDFSGAPRFYFSPVCQFEIRTADGEHARFEQLICELTCAPDAALDGIDSVLWSFDHPSTQEFFAAVEATDAFRIAAGRSDYRAAIRYEAV